MVTSEPILSTGLRVVLPDSEFSVAAAPFDEVLASSDVAGMAEVVLLDVKPDTNLFQISSLQKHANPARVVLWANNSLVPELAFQAMSCGIRGVLRKSRPVEEQVAALRDVHSGGLCFEQELLARFMDAKRIVLTPREKDLLRELVCGHKNKDIAWNLGLTVGTVKEYLCRLCRKTGANDRWDLMLYALRNLGMERAGSKQEIRESDLRTLMRV